MNRLFNTLYKIVHKPILKSKYLKLGVNVNNPDNAKIISALSRRDPYKFENNTDNLKSLLERSGVDQRLLTDSNLRHLSGIRYNDILNSNVPESFAIRLGDRPYYNYDLFKNKRLVGEISASQVPTGIHTGVLSNLTRNTKNYVKGVSELGYNSVIGDLGSIISGEHLMAPYATRKVMEHFPNKTYLGHYGKHDYGDVGGFIENGPVWKLDSPTYNVPVKYGDLFNLESLSPKGQFLIDFTKGPLFKSGGVL